MSNTQIVEKIPQLESLGNVVPEGYEYYEKLITPREGLSLPNTYLKWYDIRPLDVEITPEQVTESRTFLIGEVEAGRLKIEGDLGFVLLHRAGPFLLLLVTTWRNTNEMWESSFVKEVTSAVGYRPWPHQGSHRATYCVWELGPVWHERNAWVRFICSKRDREAKLVYT